MRNTIDRDIFIRDVLESISKLKKDFRTRNFEDYMTQKLRKHILPGVVVRAISNDGRELSQISDEQFTLICLTLKKYDETNGTKYFRFDEDEVFTEEEKNRAYDLNINNTDNKITLTAIEKGTEDKPEYIGVISYKYLADIYSRGLIRYNLDTQRLPNCIISDGKIFYLADIDRSSVNAITKAILEDKFEPNTITFNILRKGSQIFKNECEELNKLVIDTDKVEVDIIDGMHRLVAITSALSIREAEIRQGKDVKPLDRKMAVCVKNLSERDARSFIFQETLGADQKAETKEIFRSDSIINEILYRVCEIEGHMLSGKILFADKNEDFIENAEDKISNALVIRIIYEMNLQNVIYHQKPWRSTAVRKLVSDFVSYLQDVDAEFFSNEGWYNENKEAIDSQVFLCGIICSFFRQYVVYDQADIGKTDAIGFAKNIMTKTGKELQFDYPFKKSKGLFKELFMRKEFD